MDKILVVEDDKTVYSGIKKLLELQHYSVVIAQNGMEALEKIDESFSLVIMDIMMPQLDGIETCRRNFINSASQEKQINKSMQMIKMELEENLKSINQAEAAYLNEINFFRLLIQKQDSLQTIKASILDLSFSYSAFVCGSRNKSR